MGLRVLSPIQFNVQERASTTCKSEQAHITSAAWRVRKSFANTRTRHLGTVLGTVPSPCVQRSVVLFRSEAPVACRVVVGHVCRSLCYALVGVRVASPSPCTPGKLAPMQRGSATSTRGAAPSRACPLVPGDPLGYSSHSVCPLQSSAAIAAPCPLQHL
jgi:hypothetical protein